MSCSSATDQSQTVNSIECSICTDTLADPRSLPCGHSFCGPPRHCLDAVEKPHGLKCAICKEDFKLNIRQLKPLYGIRDFLRQSTSRQQNEVVCEEHAGCSVEFWCEKCSKEACKKCFNSQHQSHPLKDYREHLQKKNWFNHTPKSPPKLKKLKALDQRC